MINLSTQIHFVSLVSPEFKTSLVSQLLIKGIVFAPLPLGCDIEPCSIYFQRLAICYLRHKLRFAFCNFGLLLLVTVLAYR